MLTLMKKVMVNDMDLNVIREKIADLVDVAEQRRISFSEIQSVFKSVKNSLNGRTFIHLKNKLGGEYDSVKLTTLHQNLSNIINAHIFFDDKLIFIFEKEDEIKTKLDAYFDGQNFGSYQPYKKQKLDELCDFYHFFVCREINVKVQLSLNDLKEVDGNYQEIYAIEKIPLNCHDFIMIDNKWIVVGIDLADVLGVNELNIAENNFFNFLNKEIDIRLDKRVDFFPKIRAFYDLPQNGDNGVTEISFITTAGTAHHEVLKGNATDLRQAPYHDGGVKAVREQKYNGQLLNNDITPYKINTRFYRVDNRDMDIAIKSSYRALHTANASHVYGAFIYGSRSLSDLNFAINRLTA